MRIILPVIPDPPPPVLQGEQFGLGSSVQHTIYDAACPQGLQVIAGLPALSVPPLTNLRPENYGTPASIGPKVFSGGEVVMLDYGARPVKVFVDATQAWLNSRVGVDSVGQISGLGSGLMEIPEAVELAIPDPLIGWQPLAEIPRGEIAPEVAASGLAKRQTAARLPELFGWRFNDMFTEMPAGYYISGTTRTGAGVALGACNVYAVEFGKLAFNPDPRANGFAGSVVSDAVSGAYSIQVKPGIGYWTLAYKDGPPEVAGLTAHAVTAGSYDIYLRDPTASTPSGSSACRPIGSAIVRRLGL